MVTPTLVIELYVFVLAPLINGLGHWRGAQNFRNSAYNWRILSWVTGGEGLHHNHHWMQSSARFARAPLELLVDSGWWSIWVMKQFRLAHHVRVAPLLK